MEGPNLRADGLTGEDLLYAIALRLERIAVALERGSYQPVPVDRITPTAQQTWTQVAQPIAEANRWVCPIHGQSKIVPAGFSQRTQRAYNAFVACPAPGCNERPPQTRQNGPQASATPGVALGSTELP